jgi:hypothetical protein
VGLRRSNKMITTAELITPISAAAMIPIKTGRLVANCESASFGTPGVGVEVLVALLLGWVVVAPDFTGSSGVEVLVIVRVKVTVRVLLGVAVGVKVVVFVTVGVREAVAVGAVVLVRAEVALAAELALVLVEVEPEVGTVWASELAQVAWKGQPSSRMAARMIMGKIFLLSKNIASARNDI